MATHTITFTQAEVDYLTFLLSTEETPDELSAHTLLANLHSKISKCALPLGLNLKAGDC
jgi:hypothetical protein